MNDLRVRLQSTANQLEDALGMTTARLQRDYPGVSPYALVTPDGSPVLAPILCALANVLAALAALEGK